MKKNNLEVRKEALELFQQGLALVEISRRLNIPEGTVRSWKNRYKWSRNKADATVKRKRGGQNNNTNAVGNKGNRGKRHGLFSKYFTKDTRDIYESLLNADPLILLWHNIMFSEAELLRSQKIMYVNDKNDKTVEKVGFSSGKAGESETYDVQQAWDKHANYLKAIARLEQEIRSMVRDYLELEGKSKADARASAEDWKKAIIEIAKRRGEQHGS